MDYSKLSDCEIAHMVAHKLPGRYITYPYHVMDSETEEKFDPCNNPADAWPIITENRISIVWDCSEDASAEWWNAFDQFDDCRVQYQSIPLRAAMIVFLMMQENK